MTENHDNIRSLIMHENDLINHRITWFLILQGFMLTALAFAWEKSCSLCWVFSFIGIFSSISVGIVLLAASQALEKLHNKKTEKQVAGRYEKNILLKLLAL